MTNTQGKNCIITLYNNYMAIAQYYYTMVDNLASVWIPSIEFLESIKNLQN